jgi:hypothetical protein
VVALLSRAGAKLGPQWYEDEENRRRAPMKKHADPRMLAAFRAAAVWATIGLVQSSRSLLLDFSLSCRVVFTNSMELKLHGTETATFRS